jgi:hypothetical protein
MSEDINEEMYTYPARILPSQAREHPALAGIGEPFVRSAEISSNRLDAYFTRMDPDTTLNNFARHAANGVSVLDSHESRRLGVGYSFTGETSEGEDGAGVVLSDWYTVPGIQFGGGHSFASTDDYIKAVESRIIRSISVGFYGGRHICDICKNNYHSFDCPHIGGVEYQVEGENGVSAVVATATIYGANLAEYSLVYKGATPGATIRKIEHEVNEGNLSPENIGILENRYRIHLPHRTVFTPAAIKGESNMSENVTEEQEAQARQIADLTAEVERLTPLAEDGRQYRADLVDEALAEGVRAIGAEFAQERYRTILENATPEVMRQMRDDWRSTGDARLKGGRLSEDEGVSQERQPDNRPLVPANAYKV